MRIYASDQNKTKQIAWGTSKLLEMYCERSGCEAFAYCIDDFTSKTNFMGLRVRRSEVILDEKKGSYRLVVFAVSSKSLQAIFLKLNGLGLAYRRDFILYSDFFYESFVRKAEMGLGFHFNPNFYQYAVSFTMNSRASIQTTILGTWLLLELLNRLDGINGHIAEVGAYECGNALCSLNFMTRLNEKKYYIFDSFEGFPELSTHDPNNFKKGDLKIEKTFQELMDSLKIFKHAVVVKGFVPETFSRVPDGEAFALVFYDCDLYQPALDTFEFFWDRIVHDGYLVVHDHEVEKGGFVGVKKATDEFFAEKKVERHLFFENTMAVIRKAD